MSDSHPRLVFRPFTGTKPDLERYLSIEATLDVEKTAPTTDLAEAREELHDKAAFFIYYEAELAGFIAHHERDDENGPYAYIWEIAILPQFKGKHIGSEVLRRALMDYAHMPQVRLRVKQSNIEAMIVYLKLGFKPVDWIPNANKDGQADLEMAYRPPRVEK